MVSNRVDRETLYAEVWASPMLSLASKYGVSANFLARVCARLNVPCPPRGYWARKQSGQNPKIPVLPKTKSGEPTDWEKGDRLASSQQNALPDPPRSKSRKPLQSLILGSLEPFTQGRVAGDGYLKPAKRNLPDLVVTENTLHRAAAVLQKLAVAFREYDCRLSTVYKEGRYARIKLGDEGGRLKRSSLQAGIWYPGHPTLVFIGDTAIGLTIYEQTIEKEVQYLDGKFVPVGEARKLKPKSWSSSWVSKQSTASGKLCLRAYSPYRQVSWIKTWTEDKESLAKQIEGIISSLREAAETLGPAVVESDLKAAEEHKKWEEERIIAQAKYEKSLIEKARADSLRGLVDIINKWSETQKYKGFFEYLASAADSAPEDSRSELRQKIEQAKSLITQSDTIAALLTWRSPPPTPED